MTPELAFEAVIDRLKTALGAESDADAASALGVSPQVFSNRRKTGSILYEEMVELATKRNIDVGYLLTGVHRSSPMVANQNNASYVNRLNTELLANVLFALEAELDTRSLRLPARKRADIIGLLYDHFVNLGHVDDESFSRFMKVVLER